MRPLRPTIQFPYIATAAASRTTQPKATRSLLRMDMGYLSIAAHKLVGDLERHLHRWMDGAQNVDSAGILERDRRRVSRSDRAEIELIAGARRIDVVGDVVRSEERRVGK